MPIDRSKVDLTTREVIDHDLKANLTLSKYTWCCPTHGSAIHVEVPDMCRLTKGLNEQQNPMMRLDICMKTIHFSCPTPSCKSTMTCQTNVTSTTAIPVDNYLRQQFHNTAGGIVSADTE